MGAFLISLLQTHPIGCTVVLGTVCVFLCVRASYELYRTWNGAR